MNIITRKLEFDQASSILCGRMVSLDSKTRRQAADDAASMLAGLYKHLLNSPHCRKEIDALSILIARNQA